MPIRVEWFCTLCNASAQRREDGDEVTTGYAVTSDLTLPRGWHELGDGGHGCGKCSTSTERKRLIQLGERARVATHAGTPGATGRTASWPSPASPFDGHREPADAGGVERQDGGGVQADG